MGGRLCQELIAGSLTYLCPSAGGAPTAAQREPRSRTKRGVCTGLQIPRDEARAGFRPGRALHEARAGFRQGRALHEARAGFRRAEHCTKPEPGSAPGRALHEARAGFRPGRALHEARAGFRPGRALHEARKQRSGSSVPAYLAAHAHHLHDAAAVSGLSFYAPELRRRTQTQRHTRLPHPSREGMSSY